jgi:hypothetical protein
MPKYITLTRVTQTELPPRPTFNEESLFLSNDGKLKTLSGASGQVEDVIEGGSPEVTAASITDATSAGRSMLTAADAAAQAALLAPYIPSGGLDSSAIILAQAGDDLLAKYAAAKALTPNGAAKSATNRAALVIMPGTYALSATLTLDADFVDVVGLGATEKNPSVLLTTNTISCTNTTAKDYRVSGISVGDQWFGYAGQVAVADKRVLTNCTGGSRSFGGFGGGADLIASGSFINCVGSYFAFGGDCGIASGTFINCVGDNRSFGGPGSKYAGGEASGTFINCVGGYGSFGGGGTLSGKLFFCRLTSGGFNAVSGGGCTRMCLGGDLVENNQGVFI